MSKPRWKPTIRHTYQDAPDSFCGLCGRRYGNPIHRLARTKAGPPVAVSSRPICGECGRPGYYYDLTAGGFAIAGHLDQRIKHSFQP